MYAFYYTPKHSKSSYLTLTFVSVWLCVILCSVLALLHYFFLTFVAELSSYYRTFFQNLKIEKKFIPYQLYLSGFKQVRQQTIDMFFFIYILNVELKISDKKIYEMKSYKLQELFIFIHLELESRTYLLETKHVLDKLTKFNVTSTYHKDCLHTMDPGLILLCLVYTLTKGINGILQYLFIITNWYTVISNGFIFNICFK